MSSSNEHDISEKKYKGIRRRKWGKWVTEIRVPGTQDRLWLGSYSTPEAAAVAHDTALYCLRGLRMSDDFNFPEMLPTNARVGLSPRSVQRVSSDAGMAIDAKLASKTNSSDSSNLEKVDQIGINGQQLLNVSVEDYL